MYRPFQESVVVHTLSYNSCSDAQIDGVKKPDIVDNAGVLYTPNATRNQEPYDHLIFGVVSKTIALFNKSYYYS